jgi:hypothetical protein
MTPRGEVGLAERVPPEAFGKDEFHESLTAGSQEMGGEARFPVSRPR